MTVTRSNPAASAAWASATTRSKSPSTGTPGEAKVGHVKAEKCWHAWASTGPTSPIPWHDPGTEPLLDSRTGGQGSMPPRLRKWQVHTHRIDAQIGSKFSAHRFTAPSFNAANRRIE